MTDFAYAIGDSLQNPDWEASVEGVRNAVITEVKTLDPDLRIHYTGYFNHSYAPDFVLAWEQSGERASRDLYLRFDVMRKAFVEDLRHLRDERPLFLGMTETADGNDGQHGFEYDLEDGDPDERCLVTVASAIGEWEELTDDGSESLATSALIRGGRGLLDDVGAARVGQAVAEGIPAVLAGEEPDKVAAALEALQPYLPAGSAERLERKLRFLWLGSGGRAQDFPGKGFGLGGLDDEELRELLLHVFKQPLIGDDEYWRQLGMHLSAHRLGELIRNHPGTDNLEALVRANVAGWTAKGAGARPEGPTVPLVAEWGWSIQGDTLTLNLGDVALSLTDDRRHFNNWAEDGRTPTWKELRPKLADHNVTQVEVLTPEVDVTAKGRKDRTLHSRSEDLDRFLGDRAEHDAVTTLTVQVPGTDDTARVDFPHRTVDAGDSNLPVLRIALLAARYLSGMGEDRLQVLERYLEGREGPEALTA